MRTIPFSGRSLVALVFAGSSLLAACGAEQNASNTLEEGSSAMQALVAGVPYVNPDDDGLGDLGGADDDEGDESSEVCNKLRGKLQKDAMAMQRTAEFRALAKTKEFKKMAKTVQALQEAGCSLNGSGGSQSPECFQLKLQAMQDQQAMMKTPQFKKLEKTKEYKAVMKDARAAQQKGCLDDNVRDGLMVIL